MNESGKVVMIEAIPLQVLEGAMPTFPLFRDRHEAGKQLAQVILAELSQLNESQRHAKPIVYALPRGGLPVAEPVARLLECPLDLVVAKKITWSDNPELAIGAVTADGHMIRSRYEPVTPENAELWKVALHQAQEKAQAQFTQLAVHHAALDPEDALVQNLTGKIALLVDDGIATGMTIAVAAQALRARHPQSIWICAPVAPQKLLESLQQWGDRVIVLAAPDPFLSVSRFYEEFPQVEMEEAMACLLNQERWLNRSQTTSEST